MATLHDELDTGRFTEVRVAIWARQRCGRIREYYLGSDVQRR